jgi:excisionase family DNA binding protein
MKKETKVVESQIPPVGALKVKAAAKYLGGVAPITVRRLIDAGKLKPCRHLRHLLIPVSELDRFLRS